MDTIALCVEDTASVMEKDAMSVVEEERNRFYLTPHQRRQVGIGAIYKLSCVTPLAGYASR